MKGNNSNAHRADIVAMLHKSGTSLAKLGAINGLSPYTLKNALDKPYPRGEKIISDHLGINPAIIWPERYLEHSSTPTPQPPNIPTPQPRPIAAP